MEENLLGYCLDALDEDARRQVEDHLRTSPEDRARVERLRRATQPLEADRTDPDPPADLILRTLAGVAASRSQTLPLAPPVTRRQPVVRGWWRRPNLAAAAVLFLAIGGVGVPWIIHSRNQARVLGCANNLRQLNSALVAYADDHNNEFPRVPTEGPCNFAGSFVPVLHDHGLFQADTSVVCPGQPVSWSGLIGSGQLDEMQRTRRGDYEATVQQLGGSYAYTLGYYDGNRNLRGLRSRDGGSRPLLADRPPFMGREEARGGNSPNHGGKGQNVLFTDGSVRFHTTRTVGDDDIFVNRDGKVRAGSDERDTVLGSSDANP